MAVTEIIEVVQETHDVKSFFLRRPNGFVFIPGQYALISIPGAFSGTAKPFTMSSSPTEGAYIRFSIKRMGEFTSALHNLRTGDRLIVIGPAGDALSFSESIEEEIVLIAGGSGITPFMSIMRYAAAKELKNRITLFYSNRTEQDIIFRKDLERLAEGGRISLVNTLTDAVPDNWQGETGVVDRAMIERHMERTNGLAWFVCGPPGMVKALKATLLGMGIEEASIYIEDWQIPGKGDKNRPDMIA